MEGEQLRPDGTPAAPAGPPAGLVEQSKELAVQSARSAAATARASADVHDSAARLHHRSAQAGLGDVDEHRRLAGEHEEKAAADRAEALVDDRLGERIRQGLPPDPGSATPDRD